MCSSMHRNPRPDASRRDGSVRIADLQDARAYPHPVGKIALIETHISWVLLTGDFAYKIKKPVDFGFLDFSTLDKRRTYCEAELRLNRRFAPGLYRDVVPITATASGCRVGGEGPVIDWAVKMKQFPAGDQMDERLAAGRVAAGDLGSFAEYLAGVHASVPIAAAEAPFGTREAVWGPAAENFEQIAGTPFADRATAVLATILAWSRSRHGELSVHFDRRRSEGFVRECHGDLHLSNLVWLDGKAVAFDCIEFNPGLRWIDVLSDAAFLVMDLETRQRADLAHAFLDRYLEVTGDYGGMRAFDFYLVYRSLVRAKVAALQARGASGDLTALAERFDHHVEYARRRAFGKKPALIVTCGLSGSGKSWLSERLVTRLPAVRVRSDVERKRLHGVKPSARAGAEVGGGLYGTHITDAVYERLEAASTALLEGGETVIADATFLDAGRRDRFRRLATDLGVDFRVLYCTAPESVLQERVAARQRAARDPSDADVAVLTAQIRQFTKAPAGDNVVTVDTAVAIDWPNLLRALGATAGSPSA